MHICQQTLGVNFINVLRTNFSYERHFSMYMKLEKVAKTRRSYEKFVRLTLMKLTLGVLLSKVHEYWVWKYVS